MGLSGAQKRKKKREKEEVMKEAVADMERLKLGPTKLWTGLVLHHKDVFDSHVIPKLNGADRFFFSKVVSIRIFIHLDVGMGVESLSLGEEFEDGRVKDQAWFCMGVAGTNKLEFLKWAREVKHCEWDKWTIIVAASFGNLEMLKYCFSNDCPCDEEESCKQAASEGHLDCLRFLVDKVKPSRETEKEMAIEAAAHGHLDILIYFVEERKISDVVKHVCMCNATRYGRLDCLKYLLGEEAKTPPNDWQYVAYARYYEHPECLNYLLEKGCPEPTDEQYALIVECRQILDE
ncbi:unnamed protein product [Bathycoccus prasinos]